MLELTYDKFFNLQQCKLYFGSWCYDKNRVDIQKLSNKSYQYMYHGHEWSLVEFKAERFELNYDDELQYPYISLTMKLKRVSSFYKYIFIGPTVLSTILTLFALLVPPSSGERMILCKYKAGMFVKFPRVFNECMFGIDG